MNEWEKYKFNNDSAHQAVLSDIYHVTHIETAFRIFKDKSFKAGLVNDQSKLNKQKIL